ncbi:MAG TPA: DUF2889 domain-containing protein [Thiolinea sp.]|nr:DUF2889 domain-containing protein [Thiolinea sp.]
MRLPATVKRTKLHHRSIQCEGFKREDGLWDIEAHLTDQRSYDCSYDPEHRGGLIRAGANVHNMWVRLTLDLDFMIHDAVAISDETPFPICFQAAQVMPRLIGMKMGKGWLKEVRVRISTEVSCTHLIDLLTPIANTAYQTMHYALEERAEQRKREDKNFTRQKIDILDTCIALASDGEVVKRQWPEFYTGAKHERPI